MITRAHYDDELRRLKESRFFARSGAQMKLLQFLLECSNAEGHDGLKETYIGTMFYGRSASYDPQVDSIVRVNVNRLRHRLEEYYASEGLHNPIRILIPRAMYEPLVRDQSVMAGTGLEFGVAESTSDDPGRELLPVEPVSFPPVIRDRPLLAATRWPRWLGIGAFLCLFTVVLVPPVKRRVMGSGVSFYRTVFHTPPAFTTARLQSAPITMGAELEFEPNTTIDGRQLAYVSRLHGSNRFQIFLRNAGDKGKPDQPLDTGPESALYPAWSPDAKQIAFLRCGVGPCDIAFVSPAGGPVHTVQQLPTYCLPDDMPYYQFRQLNPIWTNDGRALIFPYRGQKDNAERLVIYDLSRNTQTLLTTGQPSEQDAAPALSPDGRTVAFLRRHLSWTQVMTVDLTTRATRVLETEPNVTASGLTWSPDGRGVVLGANRRKRIVLLWIPLHGAMRYLDANLPSAINPVFAGDGKSLMVISINRSRDLSTVVGPDGAPVTVLRSKQRNAETAFSPDKSQLAFLSDRSGSMEVWIAQRQGSSFAEPRQLTSGVAWFPSSLVWSPDGDTLAVGISNTNQIQMVDAHTGAISPLRLPGMERSVVWSPAWSADGRSIYFAAWGEKSGVFRASAGPVPAVTQVMTGHPREVRVVDDRTLLFEPDYGHGLYSFALDGQTPPISLSGLADVLPSRAWLVAEGKLYYLNVHDSERRLHQYDLATHKDITMTQPLPRVAFADGTLSYDPAAKLLIYSAWSETAGSQIVSLRWGK